jgi:hypothetical protein
MKTIKRLIIDKNKSIEILVPDVVNKSNYYYKPTEELHKFDEVTVVLREKDTTITISIDLADVIFESLKNMLQNVCMDNQVLLPDNIQIGELGYYYNKDMKDEVDLIDYSNFAVWSGGVSKGKYTTWLYKKDNGMYFEISPNYPWLYAEPDESSNYIPFDQFMKTYKPILVIELDRSLIEKWLDNCNGILHELEKRHAQMLEQLIKCKAVFATILQTKKIDLKGGQIGFSDFNIVLDESIEQQLSNLDVGKEVEITYLKNEYPEYMIRILVDMIAGSNKIFTVSAFKNFDWSSPIFKKNVSDIHDLFATLQDAVNCVDHYLHDNQ